MPPDYVSACPFSVDVAIPCYQYGRLLRECVISVLSQGIRELRVLIIDNASTDNSLEVAQELAAEDQRVEVVAHRRNLGHHASFNESIDWARSEFFLILCADDLLAPGALARAASLMTRRLDVHLTYGRTLRIPLDGPVPDIGRDCQEPNWYVSSGREFLERCARGDLDLGLFTVVRTSVQKEVGYYRSALPYADDLELCMRFACVGSIAETDAIQGIHRTHPFSRSSTPPTMREWILHSEAAFESFFTHEGATVADSKALHRRARRSLAEQAYWCAFPALSRREARTSLDLFKLAVRLSPTTAFLPPVSYLFRKDDAIQRITHHVSEMLAWPRSRARLALKGQD